MTTSTQWQLAREAAERYERILVPAILGPFARALIERANLRAGETVVDVGCGTGAAARCAAEYVGVTGTVIGVDINPGMLEVARSLPRVDGAPIEWREGSVSELPVEDSSADFVACAQTLQFLPDRGEAFAEMRRVLAPGGRIAVSVWCSLHDNPYFDALVAAVAEHIGSDVADGLGAAFAMGDSAELVDPPAAAGFGKLGTTTIELELELPAPGEFVPRHVGATPMAAGFGAASPAARAAVVEQVAERLSGYGIKGGVRVPFRSHLVMAER